MTNRTIEISGVHEQNYISGLTDQGGRDNKMYERFTVVLYEELTFESQWDRSATAQSTAKDCEEIQKEMQM